ncbi:hypothetical protein [Streptococcus halichoeri]|uniref:hypothetical protein n=1 Tax=Streptococcus halichoeri TaxID=254785 RepID=UPI00135B12C1|nr:hypothetical protein [Streptococcus halichoeri]
MQERNWYLTLLTLFYDISADLDELTQRELMTFGHNMYLLFSVVIFLRLVCELFGYGQYIDLLLVLLFVYVQFKQERLIKSLHLDRLEVSQAELLSAKKKQTKRAFYKALVVGSLTFLLSLLFWHTTVIVDSEMDKNSFFLVFTPLATLLFTLASFWLFVRELRKKIVVIED